MRNKVFAALAMCMLFLAVFSCKKDEDPNVVSFKIVKETEKIVVGTTEVTILGTYEYPGKINSIKVRISSDDLLYGSDLFATELSGTAYSLHVSNLNAGTVYYYRYEVDYGAKDIFLTEINQFTTLSESPKVQTLEVLAMDSTTFRIKCEVLSDGGSEVTERGVCWNTYGDPTMDDETTPYPQGGIGQYTVRMEHLASNTIYYVRAYAKNSNGTCLGELMEFRTGGNVTTPRVSTVEVSEATYNSATCLCNVSSDGGLDLSERGVCWGLEPVPTIDVHHIAAEGTSIGNYSVVISGLTVNTTYHIRAYATNEKGTNYGENLTFTTTEGLATVTTAAITNVSATSAWGGGVVTDEGASNVTEHGICWSINHNPTINDNHNSNGAGAGSYTVQMTGLTPNQTYYVRAYATNAQGISYGAEIDFTATDGLPEVKTDDVTDVTSSSAIGHGKVNNQGGSTVTERGICWSTDPSPTINGSYAQSGTGSGEYEVNLTNLTPGTKFYVRAYAMNTHGLIYGEEKEFTTLANLPSVITGEVSNITPTSAQGSGDVTGDGGSAVTEKGICWSIYPNPTINDNHISNGSGTGNYSATMSYLKPYKTYHVRAYAINSVGIAYGEDVSFVTLIPTGAINGLFTVDNRGTQVFFSQGNLQYQPSSNTWRFAENQWDYVGTQNPHYGNAGGTVSGSDNSNISSTYSGWIDLFCWGTSGYNHGAICYQPWSTSLDENSYFAYGNPESNLFDNSGQADWGYNAISNGGNQENLWRTLSDSEWQFVIHDRNTISGILCAPALVNNVNGLVILPDSWSADLYSLDYANTTYSFDNPNVISESVWLNVFQANGAVFLPAAGSRLDTNVYDVDTYGSYWLSSTYLTAQQEWYAYTFGFRGVDRGLPASINRIMGRSVRLVQIHY